jgi:hypothetical protein
MRQELKSFRGRYFIGFNRLLIAIFRKIYKETPLKILKMLDKIAIKNKYLNELKLRNYSRETIKNYIYILNDFLDFADNITNEEVKRYFNFLKHPKFHHLVFF